MIMFVIVYIYIYIYRILKYCCGVEEKNNSKGLIKFFVLLLLLGVFNYCRLLLTAI